MPFPRSSSLRSGRRSLGANTQLLIRQVLGDDSAFFDALTEVVVIDTETTGTGPDARLVEIAAVHARHGVVVREFESLINPGIRIPPMVIRIHGITDAMVSHSPRADDVLPAFLRFVGALPLVAHNAGFDRSIIAQELRRVGIPSPGIPVYCTVRMARKALPEAPNHRLGTLATFLSLNTVPSHRARADCHAALGVLRACAARLPGGQLAAAHGAARPL